MTKSKFKLDLGLAQVVITGEPVFIRAFSEDFSHATVIRPVVTSEGVVYKTERFPVAELETAYTAAKRKLELDNFLYEIHKEAENKRYALPKGQAEQLKLAFPQAQKPLV